MDPHAFENEEASDFAHNDGDAENCRQCVLHLVRLGHLDQPIATLLVAGYVGTLVGDQARNRTRFLTKLQPSPVDLKVSVPLNQRSFVFRPELPADFDGSRRIRISRLQLQISPRPPDSATLYPRGTSVEREPPEGSRDLTTRRAAPSRSRRGRRGAGPRGSRRRRSALRGCQD